MKTAPPNGKSTSTSAANPAGRVTPGGSVDKGSIDKGSIDKGSMDRGSMDKGSLDRSSVDKGKGGGKKKKAKPTPEQQKQMMVVVISAVIVLAVAVSMYAYFSHSSTPDKLIRVNGPPAQVAAFTATDKFDQLSWEMQDVVIKQLAKKKKELEAEYKAGKFNKKQFEDVLAIVWLGKQFDHMDKYYSFGAIDKKAYLDHLIDSDKIDENDGTPKPKDAPEKSKEKIKAVVEKMPSVERRKFEDFRLALKERGKERDREDARIKKAAREAAAASRPTSRPATHVPGAAGTAIPPAKPLDAK
jgi:hypothetical protein